MNDGFSPFSRDQARLMAPVIVGRPVQADVASRHTRTPGLCAADCEARRHVRTATSPSESRTPTKRLRAKRPMKPQRWRFIYVSLFIEGLQSPSCCDRRLLTPLRGAGRCHSAAARGPWTAAVSARLCRWGPRLRCVSDPMRIAHAWHRSAVGHAPHCARERFGPLAVGCGTHVRLAQSVSTLAHPLRQTRRHPRGVSLIGLYADLLAVPAKEVAGRVSAGRLPSLQ